MLIHSPLKSESLSLPGSTDREIKVNLANVRDDPTYSGVKSRLLRAAKQKSTLAAIH